MPSPIFNDGRPAIGCRSSATRTCAASTTIFCVGRPWSPSSKAARELMSRRSTARPGPVTWIFQTGQGSRPCWTRRASTARLSSRPPASRAMANFSTGRPRRPASAGSSDHRHSSSATRCSSATTGSISSRKRSRRHRKGEMADQKVCVITGVGPGTGAALARRFAKGGYRVALIARTAERLRKLEAELKGAKAYPCDVSNPEQVGVALEAIERDLGHPSVLIHNAVGGAFGSFLEIDPEVLNRNFQVNTMALLHFARRLAPAMIEAGEGTILVTGNTSALRGKPRFAGFAPTKAAQRILAEAMAGELGPERVHVAYMVIDAVIDLEWTRRMFSAAPNEFFIRPAAIAEEAWHVAHQDRCAWSFHVEVRPFGESW